jgi:outer membrane protein OmpA-like peptidoglycan-associated protein
MTMQNHLRLLFILNIFILNSILSQNLLQNGDFEAHRDITCLACYTNDENFAATIKPWRKMVGGKTIICDCKYKKNSDEQRRTDCLFDKIKPHSGCTMMQLDYSANCRSGDHQSFGCASYLATTLPKPLEIGKNYELSFWINILIPDDIDYVQHIGVTFFPKMFQNKYGAMLQGTPFVLDTIIYNEWYKVRWIIKPTCALQCFAIGVFRDDKGPLVNGEFDHDNFYYVDDVEIKEYKAKTNETHEIGLSFCKYENQSNGPIFTEIEGISVFFDSGDSILTSENYMALDSFALRVKGRSEAAFSINGHTDNVGNDHLNLSKARVESALIYLEKQHKISRSRFMTNFQGDQSPNADNSTELGRSQNRRVEIRHVSYNLPDVVYRNVLLAVFDKKQEIAFQYLEIWLNIAEVNDKILMQNDPRLYPLKNHKRWKNVLPKVKNAYKLYSKPAFAYALDSLWLEDQRGRTLEKYIENLQAYRIETDSSDKRWDVFFPYDTGALYEKNHQHRQTKMFNLLLKNGYPKTSEVGKRAAKAVFLIMAHATDISIINQFLPQLESNCKIGEAEWIYYATIYDHSKVLEGKPQRYGTQYKLNPLDEKKMEMYPLENAVMMNIERGKIGLAPLKGYE